MSAEAQREAIKEFYRNGRSVPDKGLACWTKGFCVAASPPARAARRLPGNSPCIGCYGADDGVTDYGALLINRTVASVIDSNDLDEMDRIIQEGIPDPVGSFYRLSLASSLLRRKKKLRKEN